ncbi:MAG: hypothetical protein AB7E79_09415 [Rhodospirillaceae bacterium]
MAWRLIGRTLVTRRGGYDDDARGSVRGSALGFELRFQDCAARPRGSERVFDRQGPPLHIVEPLGFGAGAGLFFVRALLCFPRGREALLLLPCRASLFFALALRRRGAGALFGVAELSAQKVVLGPQFL